MNHLLLGLAANSALPSELVDRLIGIADAELASALAGRADLSRAQAVALASRCGVTSQQLVYEGKLSATDVDPVTQPDAALALLDAGGGLEEWALLLVADPDHRRREKLTGCRGLPADVVERLASDPDVRVVAELALWATPEVAAGLASHPHAEVRRAVAGNEATPPAVLAALLTGEGVPPAARCLVCDREETPFVHDSQCQRVGCEMLPGASCDGSHESTLHDTWQAVLRNPATPTDAVVPFAHHPSVLLRWALADRPDLPPEVCALLAVDATPGIRADLAGNPAIDDDVIRVLAGDRGHDVQRKLAHNPRVPLDVLIRLVGVAKIGATLLPRIAAASPLEVEQLAESPNAAVRMLLARRRDLPPGFRDALAADPDAKVVKAVASHPGLSEAQLRAMVERHGAQVVAAVAANPGATGPLLEDLTRREPSVRKVFREVARHRNATAPALLACLVDDRVRPVAAGHSALPPQAVAELLADADGEVVEAAAANPALPVAVMAELVP